MTDKSLNAAQLKLKKNRDENAGNATFTMPETDIKVEYPKFRKHGDWQRCLRMAKNNIGEAQILYACKIATFDGFKITANDWRAYMPLSDANELLGEIFGGDDDEDWNSDEDGEEELGNGKQAKKA